MKIHTHWNFFALGLQSLGWNHGEVVHELVQKFPLQDPFSLSLSQLFLEERDSSELPWLDSWREWLSRDKVESCLVQGEGWVDWAQEKKWFFFFPWDQKYPGVFLEERDYPVVLWCSRDLGELPLNRPMVGVVGSREASAYGYFACTSLVKDLVQEYGSIILSGCARGIDMSAHKQAIACNGVTVGFVACGVEYVPIWQKELFVNNFILSIFPPNVRAQKWHFAQRNIYLSRLSQGVLVIEAKKKSGTLLTAHAALEQGRPLCVVTHPIFSKNWSGVRELVQVGAEIVASATDCMESFFPQNSSTFSRVFLQEKLLGQATDQGESEVLSFLLERGGSVLLENSPELLQREKSLDTLIERGVLIHQAGVVLLSCMIQS